MGLSISGDAMPGDPTHMTPSMDPSAVAARPHADFESLSPARFAELFEAHSRTLWCIAVSVLRDRELARDIVQESAIIALRKIADFNPGTSFAAWMGQVVRYTAMNELRKRARRRENAPPDAADESPSRAAASGAADGAMGFDEHVTAALNELDETARACLLMKVVLGLEYKDISDALGIPEGTAMSHVFRARKAMRTRLAATHGDPDLAGQKRSTP